MFKFGDVLYRPCLSYAGLKNFINVSVVREVIKKKDGDYLLSYDAFRQSWTDKVDNIGINVFTDRASAEIALANMLAERQTTYKSKQNI